MVAEGDPCSSLFIVVQGRLSISRSDLGTTELSGQMDPFQGVGEDISEYIQLSIERTYDDFVTKVAEYRERQPAEIDAVAQGRSLGR